MLVLLQLLPAHRKLRVLLRVLLPRLLLRLLVVVVLLLGPACPRASGKAWRDVAAHEAAFRQAAGSTTRPRRRAVLQAIHCCSRTGGAALRSRWARLRALQGTAGTTAATVAAVVQRRSRGGRRRCAAAPLAAGPAGGRGAPAGGGRCLAGRCAARGRPAAAGTAAAPNLSTSVLHQRWRRLAAVMAPDAARLASRQGLGACACAVQCRDEQRVERA